MRYGVAALLLPAFLPATAGAAGPRPSFTEPAAVLVNVSEPDLNRIVVDSFRANGGPEFEGEKENVSSALSGLRYRARLSNPVVRLGTDSTARLSLDILDASLRIGRFEGRLGALRARCDEAGVDVDPAHPLALDLALDLTVEDGTLRVVPTAVEIPEVTERLRLVAPTRCSETFLPRRLLWWLGKPYLRRSLGGLDERVLERARAGAARLETQEGFLTGRWEIPSERDGNLRLYPGAVDTKHRSVLLGLTASTDGTDASSSGSMPPAVESASFPSGSFVALSASFVNEVARRLVSEAPISFRRSSGDSRKLLADDSVYALVPGLRRVASKKDLFLEIAFPSPPRFEFRRLDDESVGTGPGRALIRLAVSDAWIDIRRDDGEGTSLLGSLRIDAARVGVVPYVSRVGGISFRIVENSWEVSSVGLEFDEDLVAATLQELIFGKIFETTYEPLARGELRLGRTAFVPRSIDVAAGYLVIGLGSPVPSEADGPTVAATRTGTLLGSR